MKAYEIWPVAASLGMAWHKHRERKSVHPLECVVRALKAHPRKLQDHERYDYEIYSRPHWYGKRLPHGGEDMSFDMCAIVRELWLAGAVSLVWATRAAESLLAVDADRFEVRQTVVLFRRVWADQVRKRGER